MRIRLFRFILLSLIFIFTNINSKALAAKGYVIKLNQDTIYGTIQLPKFNQVTGAYYLKGIDEEYITHKIKFKDENGKKYRMLTTDSILGYGFIYHATDYRYKRFLLKYKSIFTGEDEEYRFLSLIYQGTLELYVNTRCSNLPQANQNYIIQHPTYYEYYMFDDSVGLIKAEMSGKIKTVRDLLKIFNVNENYIEKVPQNANFNVLQAILEKYDQWLRTNHINNGKNKQKKSYQIALNY